MKETQKMETKKDRQRNIAYLRISNENETIKNQAFAIVQFSHEGDIRFFWDGQGNEEDPEKADDSKVQEISGAVPMRERESWPRIQSYINEFHPPKLYVFDTSRLGRDMIESLSVMEELEKKVPILSASPKESFLNSMDPFTRKLMLGILSWLNEGFRRDIIARTKVALEYRKSLLKNQGTYVSKKSGKVVERLGKIPWIYERDPATGELKINQERLTTTKRAIKMWYNKGSYGEIALKLGLTRTHVISIVKRRDFYSKLP